MAFVYTVTCIPVDKPEASLAVKIDSNQGIFSVKEVYNP